MGVELWYVTTASPGTERSSAPGELSGTMGGLIDRTAFGDVAEENTVRAREGQEHLARRRSASWSVHNANLLFLQEVAALHQLIDAFDAEFDGEHAARCRGMESDSVMGIVKAYVGSIADPISDLSGEHIRPEGFAFWD